MADDIAPEPKMPAPPEPLKAEAPKVEPEKEQPEKTTALPTAKRDAEFSDLEKNILKQEGIIAKGFWFARDNKMVNKEEIEKTLAASPTTAILGKLSLIDNKLTGIYTAISSIKELMVEQTDLQRKQYDDLTLQEKEAELEKSKDKGVERTNGRPTASNVTAGLAALGLGLPLAIAALAKLWDEMHDFLADHGLGDVTVKDVVGATSTGSRAALSTLTRQQKTARANAIAEENAPKPTRLKPGFTEENGRYRDPKGRFTSKANALEEIRPGMASRAGKAILSGTRKAVLGVLKGFLQKAAKYGRALNVIVLAINPMIALLESGGEFTPEVKHALIEAIAGLILSEGTAAIIGACLGSVIPGPGTIIGGFLGFGAAFALGALAQPAINFIATAIADAFCGDRTWDEAAMLVAKTVGEATSKTGTDYATATSTAVTNALGGGTGAKIIGGLAGYHAFGVGVTQDVAVGGSKMIAAGAEKVGDIFTEAYREPYSEPNRDDKDTSYRRFMGSEPVAKTPEMANEVAEGRLKSAKAQLDAMMKAGTPAQKAAAQAKYDAALKALEAAKSVTPAQPEVTPVATEPSSKPPEIPEIPKGNSDVPPQMTTPNKPAPSNPTAQAPTTQSGTPNPAYDHSEVDVVSVMHDASQPPMGVPAN